MIRLVDLNEGRHIERELMLIKVRAAGSEQREEMKRLVDIFAGRIVDVTESTYTIEILGEGEKLDAFIDAAGAKANPRSRAVLAPSGFCAAEKRYGPERGVCPITRRQVENDEFEYLLR